MGRFDEVKDEKVRNFLNTSEYDAADLVDADGCGMGVITAYNVLNIVNHYEKIIGGDYDKQIKPLFKFNGGTPVLLCSGCGVVLKSVKEFNEREELALLGKIDISGQYCELCAPYSEIIK